MFTNKNKPPLIQIKTICTWLPVLLVILFATSLRLGGLKSQNPFWVDEFSTGMSALNIMRNGIGIYLHPPVGFELNNSLTYLITTIFFQLFGISESVARIPSLIMGSFVVFLAYLLGSKLVNKTVGLISSIFIATSYFQITWSLQARGYMMQQFFGLILVIWYVNVVRIGKLTVKNTLLGFLICSLGLLTHFMFVLVIFSITINFVILKRRELTATIMKNELYKYLFLVSALLLIWTVRGIIFMQILSFGKINNVWYYHSFLWREYGMVTLLAILGYLSERRKAGVIVIATFLFVQLVFVSFFFSHYMSKYLLPIFPYLFIGMAISIYKFGKLIYSSNIIAIIAPFLTCLFIISQGYKFVIKPKQYYSINHDFREIANIDYNEVYKIILDRIARNETVNDIVMVETWMSRGEWYLRNNNIKLYYFRWEDVPGVEGGQLKKTPVEIVNDEKYAHGAWPFIANEGDLVQLIKKHPKGFIFIDDNTLPRDVIDYAEKNFKKEIFLDHYSLDDNPYSKWPATLYSWGI